MRLARDRQLAFLEDFAVGLGDGLSPIQIVREISENAAQQRLRQERQVASEFLAALNQGQPLVFAMQAHFDSDLCMLVAVGERSGVLENLITQLKGFEQQRRTAQQAFWKPLAYPAVMVVVAMIAVKFIGQNVVMKLANSVPELQWPLFSVWLVELSEGSWLVLLMVILSGLIVFAWGLPPGISLRGKVAQPLVSVGAFVIQRYFRAVLLLQTVSVLMRGGGNLDRALRAMQSVPKHPLCEVVTLMRQRLAAGERRLGILFDVQLLSPRMLFRLSNGGRQDELSTLQRVADYASHDAIQALSRLRVLMLSCCYGLIFVLLVLVVGGMGAMLMVTTQQSLS
ncbi:hypothetical protein CWE22_04655 [Pseudidiomarina aestuarii]|uniref:Type II secretion system protein GspF domain-containing protein n=1 Tax=Pseudidiomarina aestuarii TaxID=624146 RepID=A0A7Z6ZU57_9GAMM|nr:type II secretion system F family protein [Pseudidiomarina aestuarii]RUO41459.1 hypothetical protein CWE22_04655 [Pseudidiomarina aestuarii]